MASTNSGGSTPTCDSGTSRPAAPPLAPAPSVSRSSTTTEPRPAWRHAAAVAQPMMPPPTTSTSGWRSRRSGMPGCRRARSSASSWSGQRTWPTVISGEDSVRRTPRRCTGGKLARRTGEQLLRRGRQPQAAQATATALRDARRLELSAGVTPLRYAPNPCALRSSALAGSAGSTAACSLAPATRSAFWRAASTCAPSSVTGCACTAPVRRLRRPATRATSDARQLGPVRPRAVRGQDLRSRRRRRGGAGSRSPQTAACSPSRTASTRPTSVAEILGDDACSSGPPASRRPSPSPASSVTQPGPLHDRLRAAWPALVLGVERRRDAARRGPQRLGRRRRSPRALGKSLDPHADGHR